MTYKAASVAQRRIWGLNRAPASGTRAAARVLWLGTAACTSRHDHTAAQTKTTASLTTYPPAAPPPAAHEGDGLAIMDMAITHHSSPCSANGSRSPVGLG